ncbi:MAG: hypothetical protein ACT4TC_15280 [Myxococcaceae bacterium]
MRKSLLLLSLLGLTHGALAQTDTTTTTTTETSSTTTSSGDAPILASGPSVPLNGGWNQRWAFLFSLNNVLASTNILTSPVVGTIGGAFYLSPQSSIRAGINFSRGSTPAQITKITTSTGPDTVTTYTVTSPTGQTDAYALALRAEFLRRLMLTPLAPYLGAGASVGWTWSINRYTDNLSVVDRVTDVEANAAVFDVTGRAIAGVEWRIHPNFAIYADYQLNLTVFQNTRVNQRTTVTSQIGGVPSTQEDKQDRSTTAWFTWNTGLAQGVTLGLAVMF